MKIRKKLLIFISILLAVLFIVAAFVLYYRYIKEQKHALQQRYNEYAKILISEQAWLSDLQLSNGAFPFRAPEDGSVHIVPYFSDTVAMALLQGAPSQEYIKEVKAYFDWRFAHQNDASRDYNRIAGTIYDYDAKVENGIVVSESTKEKYDSVDSYAASFLMALWEYHNKVPDDTYLIDHYDLIADVISALYTTIDEDGLSYTKPDYKVKYLMDNAEVHRGLSCAISLLEQVFLPNCEAHSLPSAEIERWIAQLKDALQCQLQSFETTLWNKNDGHYEIGIDSKGKPLDFVGWENFYPDAVCQLFPILYGVVPDEERAKVLYQTFSGHFDWQHLTHYLNGDTDFYWGLTAYCGALMRDEEKVLNYLDYYTANVTPSHEYPAYNADVAWVVLTCSKMMENYQKQMDKVDPLRLVHIE